MDQEPTYAFTIPSLSDHLPLDCRIYVPPIQLLDEDHAVKGAVVAHPYAPLGGCFDDAVVLNVTQALLNLGFIVTTFNFRGASVSAGKTSWTGRPEIDDFASVIGLSVFYLQHVRRRIDHSAAAQISGSTDQNRKHESQKPDIKLVLCGYSFGSLALARLPSVAAILGRFEAAERDNPATEIFLRARTLAEKTRELIDVDLAERTHASAEHGASSPSRKSSAGTVMSGGEETASRKRRRHRDSRVSIDLSVRDIPHRIKNTLRRSSDASGKSKTEHNPSVPSQRGRPMVMSSYVLISPVLLPMTTTLAPLGIAPSSTLSFLPSSSSAERSTSGFFSLSSPALIVFGDADNFTSAKRLQQWAERLAAESSGLLVWNELAGAGHFWHGKNVMGTLQKTITSWVTAGLELD